MERDARHLAANDTTETVLLPPLDPAASVHQLAAQLLDALDQPLGFGVVRTPQGGQLLAADPFVFGQERGI